MITPTAPLAPSPAAPAASSQSAGSSTLGRLPGLAIAPERGGGGTPGATPSLLPARAGPAVIASLLLPLAPPRTLTVSILVSPGQTSLPAVQPALLPDLPTLLASLARGDSIPATALPGTGDGRTRLAAGPVLVRLESAAADLPEGTVVALRLAPGPDQAPESAATLLRASRGEPEEVPLPRLAPDARLAGTLRTAAETLSHPGPPVAADPGATQPAPSRPSPDFPPLFLLGEPQRPVPLRIEHEQRFGHPAEEAEAERPLTIDVTFGMLGRVRLELRAPQRGELALTLRSEQALPLEARNRLRDLVGAAFELGGRPAWFVAMTGPIPAAAAAGRSLVG